MKQEIKDFLSFSRNERIALVFVLTVILVLFFIRLYYSNKSFQSAIYDFSDYENEVKDFLAGRRNVKSSGTFSSDKSNFVNGNVKLFPFDPNQLSAEKWTRLGLKDWQIKVIKNYEAKGGKFYSKSDFQKMYGISPELYSRLEPYIEIKKDTLTWKPAKAGCSVKDEPILEINAADSVSLLLLPGIGPYLASNIVKYRKRLGGFHAPDQLLQVYRMPPETYEKIKVRIRVDAGLIVPSINVNSSGFYDLLKHPYIDKVVAYSITAHRQRFGKYRDIDDFKKTEGVSDSLINCLSPYLLFE